MSTTEQDRRCAFLFPGQGAQHAGMGRALAEHFAQSREVFETADQVLEVPLSRTCFEGPDEALQITETTQPAILAVSVAALRALRGTGVVPVCAAGHSLGEYSAHVAAGTLSLEHALRVVRQRGRFMQEAVPVGEGAMAAILGLDRDALDGLCERCAEGQVVATANLNSPGQVVIAGHAAAVARVAEAAKAAGARRAVPLAVSAPFHCALMQPAAERLAALLRDVPFGEPAFPVYANVDAAPVTSGSTARAALVRQVAAPVRWQESIEAMLAAGIRTFVELGPGNVLAGLLRRIDRSATCLSVSDPDGVERVAERLGGGEVQP